MEKGLWYPGMENISFGVLSGTIVLVVTVSNKSSLVYVGDLTASTF